jgi:hypothetical protein
MLFDTSIVIVTGTEHCPEAGINVYTVEPTAEVLIVAGDHVPIIVGELLELAGNTPGVPFKQYGPNCAKAGVILLVISTVIVVGRAHCPANGVNVYTVDPTAEVFIIEGDHVPEIVGELIELVGNKPGVLFKQYGPNWMKVGVIVGVITILIMALVPHCPVAGVKV